MNIKGYCGTCLSSFISQLAVLHYKKKKKQKLLLTSWGRVVDTVDTETSSGILTQLP